MSRRVLDYGFKLDAHHLAPSHDIYWHFAGKKGQAAFWRQAGRIGYGVFSLQMAAGIDRMGRAFARLSQRTIENRRSAMGHADPTAPPFIPAHDKSRTVSFLRVRVLDDGLWFYWLMDPRVKARWGKILDYHAKGKVPGAPVRDVFGFAPESLARIKKEMADWWAKNRANVASGTVGAAMVPGSNLALEVGGGGGGRGPVNIPVRPKPPTPIMPIVGRPPQLTPNRPQGKPLAAGPLQKPQPIARPKPLVPTPKEIPFVQIHGTTHRDTMGNGYTNQPLIINGREATVSRRSGANDVSKLRNAKIPPKTGRRPRPIPGPDTIRPVTQPSQPPREFSPDDPKAASEWTKRAFEAWGKSLTKAEREAIDSYASNGYKRVNGLLRGTWLMRAEGERAINARIAKLDRAVKQGSVPESVIVWRGIDPGAAGIGDPAKLAGTVIADKAFLSTSLSRKVAEEGGFAKGVVLKLAVPKGSHAASVEAAGARSDEREIILPRNGRIQVTRVTLENGVHVVEGDWLP